MTMQHIKHLVIVVCIGIAACGPSSNKPPGGDDTIDAPHQGSDAFVPMPDAGIPGFGTNCTTAADCPSGLCVSGSNGNTCTTTCTTDCPAGYACRVTEVNGTYESVCLPPVVQVCSTCTADADCGTGACVQVGNDGGKFCVTGCGGEFGCLAGYTCTDHPDANHTGSYCIPPSCDCTAGNAGQVRSCDNMNAVGTCFGTELCDPANGGWQACNAPTATPEICDGTDNNCNMLIDEGTDGVACANTNGSGTCPGLTVCQGAGGVSCQAKTPSTEICNFLDDDCDGNTDEGFANVGTPCNAGMGACQRFGVNACSADGLSVTCSAVAGTAAVEKCNAIDDDCDGTTDEDFPDLGTQCTTNVGQCARIGAKVCAANGLGTVCSASAGSPGAEICNGLDDDCDGQVDEDFKDMGVYDKDTACGSCAIDCTQIYNLQNAYGTCATVPMPACKLNCDPSAFDLNGAIADGCEFLLDPQAIYVSTSDPGSVDDATCGLGPIGTGAGNHPCKTITKGVARATALSRLRVLVANGIYNEAVLVADGKSLLGGYDWETWVRDVAATSTLITGQSSVGVHDRTVTASNITTATTIEGFVIYGSVNNKPSGNSYAVYVSGSSASLQIINNVIFGGQGGPGSNGSVGGNGTLGTSGTGRNPNLTIADAAYDAKDAAGAGVCNAASNRQYANGGTTSCGGQVTNGGAGGGNTCPVKSFCDSGDPNYGCLQAAANFHWTKFTAANGAAGATAGGAGGGGAVSGDDMIQIWANAYGSYLCYIPPDSTYGFDGVDGGDGPHGGSVAGCSVASGGVVAGNWVSGSAAAGISGGNGGGGGGGGAGGGGHCETIAGHTTCTDGGGKDTLGGHGGGGGAGGCGGVGGGAATAGGGAFGIFIVGAATQPIVTGNQLFRGAGGTGGVGGAGGAGGIGGLGAAGGTTGTAVIFCSDTAGRGGNGGDGGDGSGGGGGCGGSSFGIYTSGIGAPNYCTGTTNTISGGGSGAGGAGGYSIINPGGAGTAGALGTCSFNLGCELGTVSALAPFGVRQKGPELKPSPIHKGLTLLHASGSDQRSTHPPSEHWYHALSDRLWTHAFSGMSRPSVDE